MDIQLYDTKARRKVTFEPSTPGKVGMYVCGPTVYSDAHLGHAKAQVSFDVIRRFLQHAGYEVRFVSNITDVGHITDESSDEGHDRIGERARLEKLEPMEIADKYFWSYVDDMERLNVLRPSISPRATGHIPEQLKLIQELIEMGHAYESNGSVYFDVKSWPRYGELSRRRIDELESGTREDVREEKRDPRDFALWKRAEPNHIMRWDSPWGEGFPGWHIECSAMSLKYLGEGFDIHGGGLDLQFPHHEAEIAQAEAAGHAFARYWMHNNLVTVAGGEKMSKSKGNFKTLKELMDAWDPMVLRFLLVSSHYRSVTEFGEEPLRAAAAGYARLREAYREVERRLETAPDASDAELLKKIEMHERTFNEAMQDDFNTPEAVAALFNLTRDVNGALAGSVGRAVLERAREVYRVLGGQVLGLFVDTGDARRDEGELVDTLMELVLEARQNYRLHKQFDRADALRERLTGAGVSLEDTPTGTRWKR